MLSPLFGLPIAICTLLMLAGHVIALSASDQPESRKRIRMANGVLAMITGCAMYAGACVFTPDRSPREWALAWMMVMLMVTLHVLLAMVDAINTAVLRRRAIRQIKTASQRLREEFAAFGARLESEKARQ
ncbi:MAG: hypothetical protein AAGH64_01240 [Planctomycetota bacterium]